MKRKDLSFLGCNSRLAWAIIFKRLETIILFLINEFEMNQKRTSSFLRNSIGDSKLVRLDEARLSHIQIVTRPPQDVDVLAVLDFQNPETPAL